VNASASAEDYVTGRADTLADFHALLTRHAPVPAALTNRHGDRFSAVLSQRQLDTLTLAVVDHSDGDLIAARTATDIRVNPSTAYLMVVPVTSGVTLAQAGRRLTLDVGQIAVASLGMPHLMQFPAAARTFTVIIPQPQLDLPSALLRDMLASPLPHDRPAVRIAAAVLRELAETFTELDGQTGIQLARHVIALTQTGLADAAGVRTGGRGTRDLTLLSDIIDDLLTRLSDPGLTPQAIADAHPFRSADSMPCSMPKGLR